MNFSKYTQEIMLNLSRNSKNNICRFCFCVRTNLCVCYFPIRFLETQISSQKSDEHFSRYFLPSNLSFVQVFNRDEPDREKKIHVTVKASDRGKPPLEDVCTIAVTIKDVNDNPPIFDRANYEILVPQVRIYSYLGLSFSC